MAEMVRFEHFELSRREDGSLHELGRGAMGITYKAFDTNLRCHVALKVINSAYLNSETAQQRFLREARAAAALQPPTHSGASPSHQRWLLLVEQVIEPICSSPRFAWLANGLPI
jgi:serine/threonine protein kinase